MKGESATMTTPLPTQDQADEIAAGIEAHFREHPSGVAAVYLFGSQATGRARPDSDVDVAVLFAVDPPRTLEGLPLDLEAALERRLRRPVQVIALNRAPVDLIHRVLRDGRLLINADPSRRVRFEVKARAEYLDLLPVLEEYRRPRNAKSGSGS